MKKRYILKTKLWIKICSIVITIILAVCALVNILRLAGVGGQSYNYPLDITATVICIVAPILLNICVFGSYYRICDSGIKCTIGLVPTTIKYEDILLIRQDSDRTVLLIYVKTDGRGMVTDEDAHIQADIVQINTNTNYFDDFVQAIKSHNPHTIYEILPMQKQDKKEKK